MTATEARGLRFGQQVLQPIATYDGNGATRSVNRVLRFAGNAHFAFIDDGEEKLVVLSEQQILACHLVQDPAA